MTQNYKFLKDINFPSDVKKISENNLQELSDGVYYIQFNRITKKIIKL